MRRRGMPLKHLLRYGERSECEMPGEPLLVASSSSRYVMVVMDRYPEYLNEQFIWVPFRGFRDYLLSNRWTACELTMPGESVLLRLSEKIYVDFQDELFGRPLWLHEQDDVVELYVVCQDSGDATLVKLQHY